MYNSQFEDKTEAFGQLLEQFLPKVFLYISYWIPDTHQAEECASAIFEKAVSDFQGINLEKSGFAVWIFSIARNTLIERYPAPQRAQGSPFEKDGQRPIPGQSRERFITRDEERRTLDKLIQQLPTDERDLFSLKFGGELSDQEISSLTGLPESNVKGLIFRTIRRVRDDFNRWRSG